MKVIHFESGLGNQMLNYAEYLYVKEKSKDICYMENIVYSIDDCGKAINQWNGYELDRVFGIEVPLIESLCRDSWGDIIQCVKDSKFWENNWDYSPAILRALSIAGIELRDYTMHFDYKKRDGRVDELKKYFEANSGIYARYIRKKRLAAWAKDTGIKRREELLIASANDKNNSYSGQTLSYMYRDTDLSIIDRKVKQAFQFPSFLDQKNINMAAFITSCSSVAIHARRGDFMSHNAILYTGGYFKNAVKLIRNNVTNPVFIFFCDPGSIEWCRSNARVFGLNFQKDKVFFVDWNKGLESYRDMQLMSLCKHNIITTSSFGWWSAFLNENENKITISPDPRLRTTMHV